MNHNIHVILLVAKKEICTRMIFWVFEQWEFLAVKDAYLSKLVMLLVKD